MVRTKDDTYRYYYSFSYYSTYNAPFHLLPNILLVAFVSPHGCYLLYNNVYVSVIYREADPKSKPETGSGLTAAGTTNKAEYFQKREEEMKERQKQREEKKKKYSGSGMKMTAEIMASRS